MMGTPPMREMLAAVMPVGTGGGRGTCCWTCSSLGSVPPLVLGGRAMLLAEAEWGRVALVL